jgi:DNA-3-methyladenine glycosylase I
MGLKRCEWCMGDPDYEAYHDEEWGTPLRDSIRLFEFLLLEGAQAGLSWITILRKRDNYRQAFDQFDPSLIAAYGEPDLARLMADPGIVRNRLKIASARRNARAFLDMQSAGEDFSALLWSFVDEAPKINRFKDGADVPATTDASAQMSRALKKRGFNFVGPTICYAFMQATGMVNDHVTDCYRHAECAALARRV